MTTLYRVVIHCDGIRTTQCHGVLELSTPHLNRIAQHSDIVAKGWDRGYSGDAGGDGSYDLCPVCAKLAEQERQAIKASARELQKKADEAKEARADE